MIGEIKKIKNGIKNTLYYAKRKIIKLVGNDVSYIYDEEFANKPWRDKGYKNEFKEIIMKTYNPESVVDLGCGTGDLLSPFLEEGVDVIGIDGSNHCYDERKIPKEKFILADLRYDDIDLGEFDLCMCLEVAEHVEEKYSNKLVNILTNLSRNIVFTAATPGQGGVDHVNEKPKSWWINKFEERGYNYKKNKSEKISSQLDSINHKEKHDMKSIKNYVENMMVFEEKYK